MIPAVSMYVDDEHEPDLFGVCASEARGWTWRGCGERDWMTPDEIKAR